MAADQGSSGSGDWREAQRTGRTADAMRYRIVDEPVPGLLTRYAIHPLLALIGFMLLFPFGAVFFLYNSVALRGPRMWLEIAYMVASIIAVFAIVVLARLILVAGPVMDTLLPYIDALAHAASLLLIFFAYSLQATTYATRRYLQSLGGPQ